MSTNLVNSLQRSLRASILCEPIPYIANSHGNTQWRQGLLGLGDLGRERRDGEDAVEEGLAAHLDEAGYNFGFGIRFEISEEGVGAGFPFFVVVKAELFWGEGKVRWLDKEGFWGGEHTRTRACTPRSGFLSCFYDAVIEACRVTCTVKTDVMVVELATDVQIVFLEFQQALAYHPQEQSC